MILLSERIPPNSSWLARSPCLSWSFESICEWRLDASSAMKFMYRLRCAAFTSRLCSKARTSLIDCSRSDGSTANAPPERFRSLKSKLTLYGSPKREGDRAIMCDQVVQRWISMEMNWTTMMMAKMHKNTSPWERNERRYALFYY